jgi:hypothetical protein
MGHWQTERVRTNPGQKVGYFQQSRFPLRPNPSTDNHGGQAFEGIVREGDLRADGIAPADGRGVMS